MQINFRSAENQSRWVWTDGLRTLGQREIAVAISWPAQDPHDMLLIHLLNFLENYLISQPQRILPGQTFRYGWTMLRFVSDEDDLSGVGTDTLLIEEKRYPFAQDDSSYVPGVALAITLLQLQHDALQRNHIIEDAIFPSSAQIAIACTRVRPETIQQLHPLMAHRAWQPDAQESGWFIGCYDDDHDHDDPEELTIMHLLPLVNEFPGLFPYLAMPIGTQLLFEENQVVIFPPGEEQGQIDPEQLLTSLP